MTHCKCPVCGMQSSIKKFFNAVVSSRGALVSVVGLGKGRGFDNNVTGTLHDYEELKELFIIRIEAALEELDTA